jgi:uncharacterized repeat protein (TIGR01451 family)
MNIKYQKIQSPFKLLVNILIILTFFTFTPSIAKADFFDEVVDFLNPVEHVKNIIDGRPLDNLPPVPGFSGSTYNNSYAYSCDYGCGYFDDSYYYGYDYTYGCGSYCNPRPPEPRPEPQVCRDTTAINYGGSLPCRYAPQVCQDTSAINYGGALPCRYQTPTCQNPAAINYGGALPCVFAQVCQDTSAINYGGTLPCRYETYRPQPTVNISADDTSIDQDDDTTIRWSSSNADSCHANGGDNGWSGNRNTSGSFNTGSLDETTIYRISCSNSNGSSSDSITIWVDEDDHDRDDRDEEPDVTTRNATDIRATSATLNGRVDGNGSTARAWFEYGTNYNLGYSTSRNSYGSGSRSYDRSISGLMPNTRYYFRAVAENREDIAYGSILSFYTGNESSYVYYPPVSNQPTVGIAAGSTNLSYNGSTSISWYTTNSTSCTATGGSTGWAGPKSIGPGTFYTGSLTSSTTYTITCYNNAGSATDSISVNVRGQVITKTSSPKPAEAPTSLVLITSTVDRNQGITPTLDNTRPRPGDEINYTVSYQNIGTGAITNLALRVDLPNEVDYISSNPNNPIKFGNTLIFNFETLGANSQNTIAIRMKVKDNTEPGTSLNFPATLSYVNPTGLPQSVTANVTAQVAEEPVTDENTNLGANVFGAGFLPTNIFGWLLTMIMVFILAILAKYLLLPNHSLILQKRNVDILDEDLEKENISTKHHK